ncbi:DNA primase family protein [Bradyrhizobium erythrophlei]|uniref:Putative DNA primase/helicase n=1 Tax=Bradyrhizobium erythrophlei TaxID=1437360 RepID=A0A1M5H2V4_9BRAD|nr:phage/plasmid primase, P4 family [Bradyrhizobium erythrophlei]SHG10274.1 putative DNA primase/helicase [Bradyrhizobium erythrophlei]
MTDIDDVSLPREFVPADKRLSAEQFRADEMPTLINSQDQWLAWDGSSYQPIEAATVESRVSAWLGAQVYRKETAGAGSFVIQFKPKHVDKSEVVGALADICHLPLNEVAPPAWLPGTPKRLAKLRPAEIISCRNGLLHYPTRKLYPQTAKFFTRNALPFDYDATAQAPERWLSFLAEVTSSADGIERPELVDLLREMMGYLISGETNLQRVFFLSGRPRSGKGTIMRIVTELIGKINTASPTIAQLGSEFGRQDLIGKSLATVTDMDCGEKSKLGAAASIINGISGEDMQSINRKNKDFWSGYLGARFLMAANMLPNFGSHTMAIATRLLIVPFDVSFADREDRSLTDKFKDPAALAGILNWTLDGLEDLQQAGDFSEPAASKVAKVRLIYRSSPVHGFVDERCALGATYAVDKAVLYDDFAEYCEEVGAHCMPLADFSEKLAELFPTVSPSKRGTGPGIDGQRSRQIPCYRGVRLSDERAAVVYKLDPRLGGLFEPGEYESLHHDAAGFPIALGADARSFDA